MRTVNRRKWKRFKSKPPLILSVQKGDTGLLGKMTSRMVNWGPVEDVSMGGLCVHYFAKKTDLKEYKELSLQVGLDGRKISGIRYRVVYDIKILELPGHVVIRKAGLRFENLDRGKKIKLEQFIDAYTAGEVVDMWVDVKPKEEPVTIRDRSGTVITPIKIE